MASLILVLVGVCNPNKTLKQCLVSIWTISLVTGLVRGNICPADKVNTTHDVTSATNGGVTIQQGILQQIPCTTFRPGERIALAVWYRGDSDNDPERVRLISNDEDGVKKYALTSNTGLVIKDVTKRDEGNYVCIVVPYTSINRYVVIDVHIIEDKFPAVKDDVTTTSSLAQSARHRISCPCDTTSSSTVYWSQGTGVTSETDILCSRFPDGTVLQFQRGDDFGVAADNSLILNSLQNTRETARFWCHVFKPDGSSINCYVDAEIVKDEQPSNHALQASETSFYILKGEAQTLPCINQPISEPTCEVQWFKVASSSTTDPLLNYTAWNDVTYDDDSFDLGSDFALVIKSVHEDNGGVYNCRKNSESHSVDVRVIGYTFPLDNGNITRLEEITFEVGQNYTLECKPGLDRTKARTSIWSYGQKDANHTTVIGMFKLIDSSVNVEGLKSNSCYSITVDGALQLTGCFIESDVRYWCHVFLDGALNRYYVDLVVQDPSESFFGIVAMIFLIIALISIIVCLLGVLYWKRQWVAFHLWQHNAYLMVMMADVEDSPEARLIGEVRAEVLKRVESVPVTPWATEDSSCYAPIQDVFTPLELYINQKTTNRTIRYQLESEATIFDDGIPQLKSKHVVLEGKAGSGKTTLLHKLAFDMYKGKTEAILRQVLVVFVLPADLLLQYDNLGKAVVQQLPKPTNISPESVNSFCKNHTMDVAILVDDCDDVGEVTRFIRKKALLGAYVVMATRQIRGSDYSSELTIRHITVSGFTPENARICIQRTLKDSADRSKELIEYLDEHFVPPDVESLPLNLTALCQLSLWTNGKVFRHQEALTTSELFCKLVKCLFERDASKTEPQGKGLGNGNIMEGHQLTQDQRELLIKFGQVVLLRVVKNPGTFCELSKADFNQPVENKKTAFEEGVRVGLLRVRVRGPASQTEQKAHFVLEILQDLCAGISLTRTNESLSHWLEKMLPSGSIIAKVFIFAGLSSYNAHPSVMEEITRVQKDISRALNSVTPDFFGGKSKHPIERQRFLRTHKQIQMFEIFLQLHHESRGEVGFPIEKISHVKIRLTGVSSHKLRLLSYFLKNVKTDSIMRFKIKSIKLLRLGKHPSKELRKYLEDFLPCVFEDADKEMSELKESDSENLTLGALLERVESTLRGETADMSPKYCPSDLDTGVLLALQSPVLQDMLSQSGECFLSTPAKDFAQCLLNLKDLEKIVLIGSILSAEAICELAINLGKLTQLKRLDLRLNKQIDDAAFVEVTQSVSSCRSLVDLRLSLYKVTLEGFLKVTGYIERGVWRSLKKLFLLHGSPTELLVTFLSKIMHNLSSVEVFNISALNSFDSLSDGAIEGFENAINSMKSLKKIEIENMEDLRTRIKKFKQKQSGSSKDQKQRDSSGDPPITGRVRSDPPPATKGVENIPTKSENNQDGEGRIDEQETNPGRYVFRY